jgi:predicted enzyme related to lactoylglutathione lyase
MEKVLGIGGLFFRSRDPQSLATWYATLDAMLSQLRAAGIEVTVDPETYPNGRFARLHDPEGNPIELWQPAPSDA